MQSERSKKRNPPVILSVVRWAVFVGISIYALSEAFRMRWIADDAYISFRYARNLLRGEGLVYNSGEYVEGFTNFLWTLLIAPGLSAGLDPGTWSMILSLGTLSGFFLFLGRQLRIQKDEIGWPLIALAIIGGMHHWHVFATSGLETLLFATLCFLGLFQIFHRAPPEEVLEGSKGSAETTQETGAGLQKPLRVHQGFWVLMIACLVRPDGVVFLTFAYGWLLLDSGRSLSSERLQPAGRELVDSSFLSALVRRFLPFRKSGLPIRDWLLASGPVIGLLIYELWRFYYYGDWLPNTFYAKSAYDPYPYQGLLYIGLFYQAYWYLLILLFVAVAIAFRLDRIRRGWWPMLLVLVVWHFYVIWVGGDFMFARFLIPAIPILSYLIATAISTGLRPMGYKSGFAVIGLILFLPLLRIDPFIVESGYAPVQGITEERRHYPRKAMQSLSRLAESYRPAIRQTRARLAFHGGAAFLIYYLDPVYALEASTGLTDATLARQVLGKRGRIGHEKQATHEYMKSRNVHIYMWPPDADSSSRWIQFEGISTRWQIIYHEPAILEALDTYPGIEVGPP